MILENSTRKLEITRPIETGIMSSDYKLKKLNV